MALSTKNREIERQKLLRNALPTDSFFTGIREIQKRVAKLPNLDSRSANEILYDENGLPK